MATGRSSLAATPKELKKSMPRGREVLVQNVVNGVSRGLCVGLVALMFSGCASASAVHPSSSTAESAAAKGAAGKPALVPQAVVIDPNLSASELFDLGVRYLNGDGVTKDTNTALEIFYRAANAGDAAAMYNVAIAFLTGQGFIKDEVQGLEWLRKSADKQYAFAEYWLGFYIFHGRAGMAADPAGALPWLEKAAHKEHSGAQYLLGQASDLGQGTPKDPKLAAYWYRRAIRSANNPLAAVNLGFLLHDGKVERLPGDPPETAASDPTIPLFEDKAVMKPTTEKAK